MFLFNYSDRKMHGIFRAQSEGDLEIKPYGKLCRQHTAHCVQHMLAVPFPAPPPHACKTALLAALHLSWVGCRMEPPADPAHALPCPGQGGAVCPLPASAREVRSP